MCDHSQNLLNLARVKLQTKTFEEHFELRQDTRSQGDTSLIQGTKV